MHWNPDLTKPFLAALVVGNWLFRLALGVAIVMLVGTVCERIP